MPAMALRYWQYSMQAYTGYEQQSQVPRAVFCLADLHSFCLVLLNYTQSNAKTCDTNNELHRSLSYSEFLQNTNPPLSAARKNSATPNASQDGAFKLFCLLL